MGPAFSASCSGRRGPWPGAPAATPTRPAPAPPASAGPTPAPAVAASPPAPSAELTPAPSATPFLRTRWRRGPRPDDGQHGVGEQRQRDVPVPARPAAHLVVVQADLPLGRLDTLLHRPAGPGGLGQFGHRGLGRPAAQVVRQLLRRRHAA